MDTLSYLIGKKSGSGPSGTIIDSLSITTSGHYVAPAGHAYNPVHVDISQPSGNILLTENGNNIDVAQYATATVNVQGGAPVSVQKKDVNFYDYDGTVLHSYTIEEFNALNEMPANPTHNGLTAQGWNWTLAQAKTQATASGACDIGQMYTTSDGKTRLYITISDNMPVYARMIQLNFSITSGNVTINYGDGSDPITTSDTSVSLVHNYENTGDYIITLTVNSGTVQLDNAIFGDYNLNDYCKTLLTKLEIGNGVTEIENYAFQYCMLLKNVTIPNTVTTISSTFSYCYSLQSIVIPDSITSIGSFQQCQSLKNIVIPNSATTIASAAFNSNKILQSVVIPNSVTYMEQLFINCTSLQRAIISNNITTIGTTSFSNCWSLNSIIIPKKVSTIQTNAFKNCKSLFDIHFESTTPPSISNSNAFDGLLEFCKIFIPFTSSINYLTATNYPSTSTYTYIGYATYADGTSLPSQDSSQRCNVKWYPTIMDAVNQTNQITTGNGNEIYCRYV